MCAEGGGADGSIGNNITIQNSNIFLKGSMLDIKPSIVIPSYSCDEGMNEINFINNTFSGRISIEKNNSQLLATNDFNMTLGYSFYDNYEGMEWGNINYQNGDFVISDYFDDRYEEPAFIELVEAKNLVLTNITIGDRDDKLYSGDVSDYYIFHVDYNVENVTIKNSDINTKDYGILWNSEGYAINFLFTNNTVSMHSPFAGIFLGYSNYSTFSYNTIYGDDYNDSISYAIGFGSESRAPERYNNTMNNNIVSFTTDTPGSDWHVHGTFMGSQTNSAYKNNHVTGGAYGLVHKASINAIITNNTFVASDDGQFSMLMVKGGENIELSHNTLIPTDTTYTAFSLTTSTGNINYFPYSKNITLIENTVTNDEATNTYRIYAGNINTQNSTYYLYNNNVVDHDILVEDDDDNVRLWSYQNITVNADDGLTTTLKNSSGDILYTTQGSFEKPLLSITYLDSVLSNFSEFTVYGEYEERVESEVVILNNDKAVTFSFDNSLIETTDGIINVKETSYIAFGLIAVMLLASIAMTFIVMIKDGADTGTLMTLGILAIGVSVILIVGFIIMNSVAIGIIAGV
jgi:hypothetical protein